ncbi:uncharacterized protein At1g51745-like [Typha latifolia]|uniref:uncharacterized protein At1g51745-like n=1 Tax=Typha latifolia TaxID=4733 RepID=UPI003C2F1E06
MSIDASVGRLVWVRRPNGSWWPGRILGPEEMSAKRSNSRRVGTPVKLLGREDGNIDWYNLEKSKRIKAFRCGEFDECIEKARASAIRTSKKSSNEGIYVHKEDAILHALELEKAHVFEENEIGIEMNNLRGTYCSALSMRLKRKPGHAARKLSILEENSVQELSQSVVSFEQLNNTTTTGMHFMSKRRLNSQNDSEDDASQGIKHMKDLQEIGSEMVSKRKKSIDVCRQESHEPAPFDTAPPSGLKVACGLSSSSRLNSSKQLCSSLKRKRSDLAQAYENLKRKHHCRPLAELCKGTRVIVPSYGHWTGSFSGQSAEQDRAFKTTFKKAEYPTGTVTSPDCSGISWEEALCGKTCTAVNHGIHSHSEMDSELSSMSEFVDNDCSDSFFDVPLVTGDIIDGDFTHTLEIYASREHQSFAAENKYKHGSQDGVNLQYIEGLGESGSICSAALANQDDQRMKRSTLKQENNISTTMISIKNTSSESFLVGADRTNACSFDTTICNGPFDESLECEKHSILVKSKSLSELGDFSQVATKPTDLACSSVVGQSSSSELEHGESSEAVNKLSNSLSRSKDKGASFAVELPINSTLKRSLPYQQVHHTICSKYQVLEHLDNMSVGPTFYDIDLCVQGSYQGLHVPLVSLMSKLNGKAIVGHPVSVEVLSDGFCDSLVCKNDNQPATSNCGQMLKRMGMIYKCQPTAAQSNFSVRRSNSVQKIAKPSLKKKSSQDKKSGSSPRKIRRLSSITVDWREREEDGTPVVQKKGGPAIACIPLRLVFSRINEALSCPVKC